MTPNLKRWIWITFQKEGIHMYPDAPAEVGFLRHPHRHMFHFRVQLEVFNNDRDVEFIMFKREIEALYNETSPDCHTDTTLQLDYKSCEMLAEEIIEYTIKTYPSRDVTVTVSEDGENGATLDYRI